MDAEKAAERLARGVYEINEGREDWERLERYYRGDHDLPFAPEGVNQEYMELREMAIANVLCLAVNAPCQRLRADGFRTGRDGGEEADKAAWNEVWQPNKMDARQRIVYQNAILHRRGLMSVWTNPAVPKSPLIRVESGKRVYLAPDPEDPFSHEYAVKTFRVQPPPSSGLIMPPGTSEWRGKDVAIVYDADSWFRFERQGGTAEAVAITMGGWEPHSNGGHPMGEVPFVPFDHDLDEDGNPHSPIGSLIPAQDAINTIRFNTLLAMQFSAYRQRVFTAYDPVLRDEKGMPVWVMEADGVTPKLDEQNQPIPVVTSPGRFSVDRALAFPGKDTKVFDLPESNLNNYVTVLGDFLTQFFALGQIPPQYLLTRMANLSGDALAGAESTLAALVSDMKLSHGESLEQVMRLANRARGETNDDVGSYVVWADAEARSFAQVIDAITKLISVGFPQEAAFEMIPGATPQKVERWMKMAGQEAISPGAREVLAIGGKVGAPDAEDDADGGRESLAGA